MGTRKVIDALQGADKVYIKGHAKATYMSNGLTVEDSIRNIDKKLFVGTLEEYNNAYLEGKISVGSLVIITD